MMKRRWSLPLLLLLSAMGPLTPDPPQTRTDAVNLMQRGSAAFNAGDIVAASRYWSESARICRIAGVRDLATEALIRRGEADRVLGHYWDAATDLKQALDDAHSLGDPYLIAASSGALGNLHALSRRAATAEPLLRESLAEARRANDTGLQAASANDLGSLYAATNRPGLAEQTYRDAERNADRAGDSVLAAIATTNEARLAVAAGNNVHAAVLLHNALGRLQTGNGSYRGSLAVISVGSAAASASVSSSDLRALAAEASNQAETFGESQGRPALSASASGGLGLLALQSGRLQEAAVRTQHALLRARQAVAPQIAFRMEWQLARIDRQRGDEASALQDFRGAIQTLQSIRLDFPVDHEDGHSHFQQQYGALYLEFADLLLRRSRTGPADASALLREARQATEQLKELELQDYFRDPCIVSFEEKQRGIETVAPDTAILYPIPLADRLELLITTGGRDAQITVPIAEPQLRAEVLNLRRLLERRTTNEYLEPAQRLYDLIIRPIEARLASQGVRTLVLVPDGVMRLIPLSALHNGRQFLIERYAVATVPSLRLVDPRPLSAEARRTLAAGISKSHLGFPALPYVASELAGIRQLENSTNLLDNSFVRARFSNELRDTDYTVVHLASHSQIGADPSQSFVLAYDGELSLDDLEHSIKATRFRDFGLELLTLSACQTASGDDRAALGMAGLALKAGARSVAASLWVVNDMASGRLMLDFYHNLQDFSMSKAQALQAAQVDMIRDPLLGHPAYWAPFLLIGNWL